MTPLGLPRKSYSGTRRAMQLQPISLAVALGTSLIPLEEKELRPGAPSWLVTGLGLRLTAQGSPGCCSADVPDTGNYPSLQSSPSCPRNQPRGSKTLPSQMQPLLCILKTHSAPATAVALTQKPQIFSVSQQPASGTWGRRQGRWMSDCHSCTEARGGGRGFGGLRLPPQPHPTPRILNLRTVES